MTKIHTTRMHAMIVVLVTLLSIQASVVASPASRRQACRRACHALIRHGCFGLLETRACRKRVLRQCREEGTAQCDQARACDESCSGIVMHCEEAATPADQTNALIAGEVDFTCQQFA